MSRLIKITKNAGLICMLLLAWPSLSQTPVKEEGLVQFTGIVLSSDSLKPLTYATVAIPGTRRGTVTDYNGYFTLVAKKGETIVFDILGYMRSSFTIPDTITAYKYSMVKLLAPDTLYLDEVIISPLPDRELFDQIFVKTDIPDTDLDRAQSNLERQALQDQSLSMDGHENQTVYMQKQVQKFYYAGQQQPMGILSPLAWSQFIQGWKRGDYKRQK
jgi:hypothetical protein